MDMLQTQSLMCPYCGEPISTMVDCSVPDQEYIEDCQVCCQPITFFIHVDEDNEVTLHAQSENE